MVVRKVSAEEILGGGSRVVSANSNFGEQFKKLRLHKARELAVKAHGDQLYGDRPYEAHLEQVVQLLEDSGASPDTLVAGWLHDVLEDTSVSLDAIRAEFGARVAKLVWAVTGEGNGDRRAHSESIYRKIGDYPDAAIVKLADRIANIEASSPGDKHALRYAREHSGFGRAVSPYVPQALWERYLHALEAKSSGSTV